MPRRTKPCPVTITEHARERYQQRGGAGRLTAALVRRRLLVWLRIGLPTGPGASVRVPLDGRLAAVLVPNSGQEPPGYTVVTVEVMHDEDGAGKGTFEEALPSA